MSCQRSCKSSGVRGLALILALSGTCYVTMGQGLTTEPKLAWSSQSSCLSLLSAGIIGVYNHAQPSPELLECILLSLLPPGLASDFSFCPSFPSTSHLTHPHWTGPPEAASPIVPIALICGLGTVLARPITPGHRCPSHCQPVPGCPMCQKPRSLVPP
jgi:hypothetical protein